MSEKLDKLRATLKKEQERRIKLNNRIAVLERRIQEEEAAEVSSMVRTANVTPEQLAERFEIMQELQAERREKRSIAAQLRKGSKQAKDHQEPPAKKSSPAHEER